MRSFADADWTSIETLRTSVAQLAAAPTLVDAAAGFARIFATSFDSVVLSRVFAVLPLSALPPRERAHVTAVLPAGASLSEQTPVLSLLGTCGKKASWSDREVSAGHRAIPLLDSTSVANAPMIAKLLADLQVDLKVLDDGRPIATRQMLGGNSATFFVGDAVTAVDASGRFIIPARDFATELGVRTVFGMGGAYLDGTLVVAILFCAEVLDRLVVDRFPSFITSFKMATSNLVRQARIFA